MAKKIFNLLIFLPIGILLIMFCVANRHSVSLSFNPFNPDDQFLSLSAPFFLIVFIALIIGILVGSVVTWFSQGKYRKRARIEAKEAVKWHQEAGRHQNRAEEMERGLTAVTHQASGR